MSIALWILAGGALGWLTYTRLHINEGRGKVVSVLIGIAGGFVGGQVLAPMFGAVAAVPGDFSIHSLIVALLSAAACLVIANKVHDRFGV